MLLVLAETHSLQTLHTILSTGSPLKAQSYEYVYRCIKSSVLLGSISGTAGSHCVPVPGRGFWKNWMWESGLAAKCAPSVTQKVHQLESIQVNRWWSEHLCGVGSLCSIVLF